MVRMLAEIGQKAGVAVYADLDGWRQNEIPLKLPSENLSRIKEIAVIWFKSSEATHEFEVENTTGITETIVRGSNLISTTISRYVVIPEEREGLLARKIAEPALKERVSKDGWHFLRYGDVQNFYAGTKRKKTVDVQALESSAHFPKMKRQDNPILTSISATRRRLEQIVR